MSTAEAKVMTLAELAPDFRLNEAERAAILAEVGHYPEARAASIEALKIAQRRLGWVPDAAVEQIAELLGLSAAEIDGVATFYNQIYRQPVGRHVIKLCDSISCYLTGYEEIQRACSESLGIGYGQTTADRRYTLLPICCLGACDRGPVLMVDDDTHFDLRPESVPKLLEGYE